MNITEDMVKEIILEVLKEMQGDEKTAARQAGSAPQLQFQDLGTAKVGTNRNEVVIGVPPAFGVAITQTIIDIPHKEVLKEIMAGI